MVAVHYKGGGPAINDLVAGTVQVMLIQAGGAIGQNVRSGKLVGLRPAAGSARRIFRTCDDRRLLPGLPRRLRG